MAWNPSPEVQVSRDAAARLSAITKGTVNRCIVMYTTAEGKIGYASYGMNSRLCVDTKALADHVYRAARDYLASPVRR